MGLVPWLLVDADDTLWESNIFFEEAVREFISYVDHPEFASERVRAELDRVEARNVKLHGYGTGNFGRNLLECFEGFRGRPATPEEQQRLRDMTRPIWNHPIILLEGVRETLADLESRYPLALVTKGAFKEQQSKVDRSGLAGHFRHVANVPEKDVACYRSVVRELGCDSERTWMIGNSPKSDINPALKAGLGAVLVPHRNTWSLEQEAVPASHARLRVVRRFSDLGALF